MKLHQTSTERADEFLQKHIGELIYPPNSIERFQELGPWEPREFEIQGEGWKTSCVDIVISGLGWISVTGAQNCKVRVLALTARPCTRIHTYTRVDMQTRHTHTYTHTHANTHTHTGARHGASQRGRAAAVPSAAVRDLGHHSTVDRQPRDQEELAEGRQPLEASGVEVGRVVGLGRLGIGWGCREPAGGEWRGFGVWGWGPRRARVPGGCARAKVSSGCV